MVGSFSKRNCCRPDRARLSISFSETNSITSWPRSRSASATATPGNRWPPVPPHAITAFIRKSRPPLHPRERFNLKRSLLVTDRLENGLPINAYQQADAEQTLDQVRTAV